MTVSKLIKTMESYQYKKCKIFCNGEIVFIGNCADVVQSLCTWQDYDVDSWLIEDNVLYIYINDSSVKLRKFVLSGFLANNSTTHTGRILEMLSNK